MSPDPNPFSTRCRPGLTPDTAPSRAARSLQYLPGIALVSYALVLLTLSPRLASNPSDEGSARALLATASMLAGAVYLAAIYWARAPIPRHFIAWTLGSALVARGLVCLAPPLLETDYFRYLWDGAVTAQGISPYQYTPRSVLEDAVAGEDAQKLRTLARNAGEVLPSINHPDLITIYPPLAQAAFALSHWIDPFGIGGWRAVLFVFDGLTVLLLARWLQALSLPVHQVAWYVSNPLLLREVYSALHMDVLVLPFVVGAGLLATRHRNRMGAFLCTIGSAIKVWPILLVSYFVRSFLRSRRVLALTVLASSSLMVLFLARTWTPGLESTSGLVAYGESWQNNDGFFRAGIWLTERTLVSLSVEPWHSHAVMRVISASLIVALLLWRAHASRRDEPGPASDFLLITGAIFLLSPTQFPWYWLWMLPLLAVRPVFPLLLYVVLLPLYHLQDMGVWVYWLEHFPVWGLLAIGAFKTWRSRASARGRIEVAHA